jgi:hypothetical protein
MGMMPSRQPCESRKVQIRREPVAIRPPVRTRRAGARANGTLWKRKMHTLAVRRTKQGVRRDSAGRPMKRG